MLKSRKGEEAVRTTTVNIILAVVIIGLLIFLIVRWAGQGDEATQAGLCRTSVLIRDKATIDLGVYKAEKLTPLACNPIDLEQIKGSREEIKREISNKAARCWWQYAEGSVANLFDVSSNEKGCRVCYFFSLPSNMNSGTITPTDLQVFRESARESNSISGQEMYNFMVFNTYNPGLIYGGGTKRYIGDYYEFSEGPLIENPREYTTRQVRSVPISSYVRDYSGILNENTINLINEAGVELQQKGAGNLHVIVVDEFKSMEKADATDIITALNMNSNKTYYDAALILVDWENNKVRIHLGFELSRAVKEHELHEMMRLSFSGVNEDNADSYSSALGDLVTRLKRKLLFTDGTGLVAEHGINPGTYYYYLSNAGYNWPLFPDKIISERTYAIAYISPTDSLSFWDQLYAWLGSEIKGKQRQPNNIIIAQVNEISQYCDME